MRLHELFMGLLLAVALCLGTWIEPWFQGWEGNRTHSANLLKVALGDGMKLFAKQIYAKADAYFHNGFYPSIYDNREDFKEAHIAEGLKGKEQEEDEHTESFLGKPKDWIDSFGRHFYPARHTHLGDSGCGDSCCQRPHEDGHDHDEHAAHEGAERELLPWLQLSAQLDPERVETYTVTAYWLRRALKRHHEAEQCLREGLRHNPNDPELTFELGKIYFEDRKDVTRARNLWEIAWSRWQAKEARQPEPNLLLAGSILGSLAKIEESEQRFDQAIAYLSVLRNVSPNPAKIDEWIAEVRAQAAPALR